MSKEALEEVLVKRVYLQTETLSSIFYKGKMLTKGMELPWKDNQRSISCVPEGTYLCTKEPPIPANDPGGRKQRDYWHFRIHGVPGRSGILIHRITYVKDLQGCLGTGMDFKDWNNDGVPDMADSTKALDLLVKTLPDKFNITFKEK